MRVGEFYEVSKCFSQFDIPNTAPYVGLGDDRVAIAAKLAGKVLRCTRVSISGTSAWFDVLHNGRKIGVPVHIKFLFQARRPEFVVESVYCYEYYDVGSEDEALQAARDKFPGAKHRIVPLWQLR